MSGKLPEELRANYLMHAYKFPDIVEQLKVAAALKLWENRGYRSIRFEVPLACGGGKRVFVKVLARDAEGVVAIECASSIRLSWLRRRIAALHGCLPPDSYLIIIFPSTMSEHADKALELADEIWVTGKDNTKVEKMTFLSVLHKE
jgi:hypothetical protein